MCTFFASSAPNLTPIVSLQQHQLSIFIKMSGNFFKQLRPQNFVAKFVVHLRLNPTRKAFAFTTPSPSSLLTVYLCTVTSTMAQHSNSSKPKYNETTSAVVHLIITTSLPICLASFSNNGLPQCARACTPNVWSSVFCGSVSSILTKLVSRHKCDNLGQFLVRAQKL
jgi:hypothetical protein